VQNKINIAIIVPGGIGTGKDSIGVPVMERIIKSLSNNFNITVFQLYKVNQGFTVNGFDLIEVYSSNRALKYLKLIYHFWRVQQKKEIQIVHGFWTMPSGFLSVLIGKIFRIKSVVSVLGGDAIALPEIHYGQLRSPLYRKLIFWALSEAHQVIVLTQYLIDNLKKYGFYREDIKVIPWGIDGSLFSYKEKSIARPVQFLHIANLHPVKDQETLLRAFKIISDEIPAHLLIIGERP
jgi:glycosyltransferase involved in cell wall biosynthesis